MIVFPAKQNFVHTLVPTQGFLNINWRTNKISMQLILWAITSILLVLYVKTNFLLIFRELAFMMLSYWNMHCSQINSLMFGNTIKCVSNKNIIWKVKKPQPIGGGAIYSATAYATGFNDQDAFHYHVFINFPAIHR